MEYSELKIDEIYIDSFYTKAFLIVMIVLNLEEHNVKLLKIIIPYEDYPIEISKVVVSSGEDSLYRYLKKVDKSQYKSIIRSLLGDMNHYDIQ